jgi:hypothetical protein
MATWRASPVARLLEKLLRRAAPLRGAHAADAVTGAHSADRRYTSSELFLDWCRLDRLALVLGYAGAAEILTAKFRPLLNAALRNECGTRSTVRRSARERRSNHRRIP